MHVVGSFARGAFECGDLDLVARSTSSLANGHPTERVQPLISRRAPRVQIHIGTPDANSSRAKFPEAVLLWCTKDRDWRARVGGGLAPTLRLPLRRASVGRPRRARLATKRRIVSLLPGIPDTSASRTSERRKRRLSPRLLSRAGDSSVFYEGAVGFAVRLAA